MEKITYDDIIKRIGYFRTKANLSMRETSLQLGHNPQFMSTIENKSIELKVKTLLEFCDIVDITPQDFFYMGEKYNKEDKNVLQLYNKLSLDSKKTILELMEKILRCKIEQNPYVLKKLLETKDYTIVEDSPKDNYWGWGINRDGENNLGKIWMKLREEYKSNKY